ncbi:MAG: thioredoxin domain-containing protein [Chthoniobacterales bacterium]
MNPTHNNLYLKFVSEVLQAKGIVLVAFWAPWSKPCQVMDPILLEVAQTCAGKIEVVKVNADDNPDLSLWLGVQHIPTLLHFEAGSLRDRLVGTASKEAILNLLSVDSEAGHRSATPSEGETI